MKNIAIAVILSVSLIICASILTKDRYKIIMNDGGLLTLKYDTVSGVTWRLSLPENNWTEIPDSGRVFVVPELNERKGRR